MKPKIKFNLKERKWEALPVPYDGMNEGVEP